MTRNEKRMRLLLLMLWVTLGVVPQARSSEDEPRDLWSLMAKSPAAAELVVGFEDLKTHIRTPQGRAAGELLGGFGFREARRAWSRIARSLGMDDAELASELLGRRAVFVFGGGDVDSESAPWAVATDVGAGFAAKLARKLDAAPRRVAFGAPLLSVDDGRYVMVSLAGERNDERRTLVFGPGGAGDLVRAFIRSLNADGLGTGSRDTWGGEAHWRMAAPADPSAVVFAWRRGSTSDHAHSIISLACRRTETGWRGEIRRPQAGTGEAIESVSPDVAESLQSGAIAAVYGVFRNDEEQHTLPFVDAILDAVPSEFTQAIKEATPGNIGGHTGFLRVSAGDRSDALTLTLAGRSDRDHAEEAARRVAKRLRFAFATAEKARAASADSAVASPAAWELGETRDAARFVQAGHLRGEPSWWMASISTDGFEGKADASDPLAAVREALSQQSGGRVLMHPMRPTPARLGAAGAPRVAEFGVIRPRDLLRRLAGVKDVPRPISLIERLEWCFYEPQPVGGGVGTLTRGTIALELWLPRTEDARTP